ncbi:MAG: hypothetical protein OXI88_22930 [Gammaproteobacteria bacterium]|nr:hypothetical protein [Gammaproteobacteria bacterium]
MLRSKDVYYILEPVPEPEDAILIGGQALNVWAEYYAEKDPSLNTHSPFFSHDIDFLGGRTTAEQIHDAWKGKITRPSEASSTPLIAKLEFRLKDGRRVIMDFLDETAGFKNDSVIKDARATQNPHTQKTLKVLHPVHCMASRIVNTYGTLDRRSRQYSVHEIRRTQLSIKVLNHYISDLFRTPEALHEEAYRLIDYTAGFAIEDPAKRAYHMDKVDVLHAIPTDLHLGISEVFLNEHYPRIKDEVAHVREQYERGRQGNDRNKDPEPGSRTYDTKPGD